MLPFMVAFRIVVLPAAAMAEVESVNIVRQWKTFLLHIQEIPVQD